MSWEMWIDLSTYLDHSVTAETLPNVPIVLTEHNYVYTHTHTSCDLHVHVRTWLEGPGSGSGWDGWCLSSSEHSEQAWETSFPTHILNNWNEILYTHTCTCIFWSFELKKNWSAYYNYFWQLSICITLLSKTKANFICTM